MTGKHHQRTLKKNHQAVLKETRIASLSMKEKKTPVKIKTKIKTTGKEIVTDQIEKSIGIPVKLNTVKRIKDTVVMNHQATQIQKETKSWNGNPRNVTVVWNLWTLIQRRETKRRNAEGTTLIQNLIEELRKTKNENVVIQTRNLIGKV